MFGASVLEPGYHLGRAQRQLVRYSVAIVRRQVPLIAESFLQLEYLIGRESRSIFALSFQQIVHACRRCVRRSRGRGRGRWRSIGRVGVIVYVAVQCSARVAMMNVMMIVTRWRRLVAQRLETGVVTIRI